MHCLADAYRGVSKEALGASDISIEEWTYFLAVLS
jgi:hypothetical protein